MPNLLTNGGIFNYLPLYGNMTASQMGITYCLKRSGSKFINAFVENYLDDNYVLDATSEQAIALILKNIFKDNWDKRYAVLTAQYNPLQNTDKDITTTVTHSGTDSYIQGARHSAQVEKRAGTEVDPVYEDDNKVENDINQVTDQTQHGHIETTREQGGGNIGTMKSQELLQAELEVRTYDFYDSIFKDIDSYLCLHIYS